MTLLNLLNRGVFADPYTTVVEPLGCVSLITTARQSGFDIQLYDFQTFFKVGEKRLGLHELWESTCKSTPDIIGLSCMSHTLPLALVIANYHKKMYPHAKIIFGGAGPSTAADKLLERYSFIDYVIKGEGEMALLKILNHLSVKNGKGKTLADRAVIIEKPCNLNKLPFPDRTITSSIEYETAVMTARGCPYSCAFCSQDVVWGNAVRTREPENVIQELIVLKEQIADGLINRYYPKQLSFVDDTFVHNIKWLQTFGDLLHKNSLEIKFLCYARIEQLNRETLKLLRDIGCHKIHVGIESASPAVLKAIGTKKQKETVISVCGDIMDIIGCVSASFIYGFPFETLDDVKMTLDLIKQLDSMGAETLINQLMPLLGSGIHRHYSDNYILDESTIVEQLESQYFTSEIVKAMLYYVRQNPDIFINFANHKNGNVEQKQKLVYEYVGV